MNLKYFKYAFVNIIIILIIAGIYIVYIKDKENKNNISNESNKVNISKEISIGITEYDTINPILTKSLEMQYITKLVYEPLVNITKDFNTEQAIAEEWSKIDNLTYIVKLNKNKKWQNGENITVDDVIFTINKIKEEDSIYKENVKRIKNIEKIDENTLKIYLSEEIEFFEYNLCFPIIQEKTYNDYIPIGTGNFRIMEINDNSIIMQGKDIKLTVRIYKSITELYNEFTRENIDIIITQNTNYEKYIGNIGFEETLITGREFYYISCENIKEIETRKYINSIINKEKLVFDLYNKKYIVVDFPLQYGSYLNKNKIKNEEIQLNKINKITLSVNKENIKLAEEIKEQLVEKNIEVYIQEYTNSNADMILKTQTVSIKPSISKYFKDEEIKEQINKVVKIENKEILKQEYEKIINQYYEEIPFISLYYNSYIMLHNSKVKGDFSGNWFNIFYNIDTWYKIL